MTQFSFYCMKMCSFNLVFFVSLFFFYYYMENICQREEVRKSVQVLQLKQNVLTHSRKQLTHSLVYRLIKHIHQSLVGKL